MALLGGDKNMLNATNSQGCFVVGTQGDVTIFNQTPTDLFGIALTEPELRFDDIENAIVDGEPDISRLLRWSYRLVKTPFGRKQEIDDIVRWAESPDKKVRLYFVEGEGGAGKTRLAAEVALALKDKGWAAGFLARSGTAVHPAGKQGLFLILDYPEEQPKRIEALINAIRDREEPGPRLRILLLSRRRYDDWKDTFAPIRHLIGKHSIARLEPLPPADARALVFEAAASLSNLRGESDPEMPTQLDTWLEEDSDNRLSLYATAAAVHHVLHPRNTFGLKASDIIADLVQRELGRVNNASKAAELGEHALARLLALATVSGRMTASAVGRLAKPEMQIFECTENRVMDNLAKTS